MSQEQNILIELPREVKQQIEIDSIDAFSKVLDGLNIDKMLKGLKEAYMDLYKKSEGAKYFANEKLKNKDIIIERLLKK